MSEGEVKVTDKRMFTDDGELKEEFRYLDTPGAAADPTSPPPPDVEPPATAPSPPATAAEPPTGGAPRIEVPGEAGAPHGASFLDLLAMIAEPCSLYLGDLQLPDGQSAENLEMARLHIDLLEVLRAKTAGNLDPQEEAVLHDVLYRLRMRYVQKRG